MRTSLPVVSGARFFLAHTPGMVEHGSKPSREIAREAPLREVIRGRLRSYEEAAAYPPNRAFLGAIPCDQLDTIEKPWFHCHDAPQRYGPHGELMPEEEFYGLLKVCDAFELLWLDRSFTHALQSRLAGHKGISQADLDRLRDGVESPKIEEAVATGHALPLRLRSGKPVGCMSRAHECDNTLSAEVLLENLAAKTAATLAARTLLRDCGHEPGSVEYVINTGEEAVGDRYQRGGGNLAKAVAEMCGCAMATGSDVKGFCCGPNHGLVIAASLVASGVYRKVMVTAGCSLAKLGMKFQAHIRQDMPILEDVLAGLGVLVEPDDGRSPVLRLDSVGRHTVDAGSQQAIFRRLVSEPLARMGLRYEDVDKYATELHNPEITEPAGGGNVPLLNYRTIAGLAVLDGQLDRSAAPAFVTSHGMPGFSPTQGHIASAAPFLCQAIDRLKSGEIGRAMFLAKGSLFLGRMTQLSDGLSFVLEVNPGT